MASKLYRRGDDARDLLTRCQKLRSDQVQRFKGKYDKKTDALLVPARLVPYTVADLVGWMTIRQAAPGVYSCLYCGLPKVLSSIELEHMTPVVRFGGPELENLCLSCGDCNRIKGELTAGEFHELKTSLRRMSHEAEAYILRCLRGAGAGLQVRFFPRKKVPKQ